MEEIEIGKASKLYKESSEVTSIAALDNFLQPHSNPSSTMEKSFLSWQLSSKNPNELA